MRLGGTRGGCGRALGRVLVLPVSDPLALLFGAPLDSAGRPRGEPPDVVVVARSAAELTGLSLPWGRVAGLVLEEEAELPAAVPWVSGVAGAAARAQDAAIALVDADRRTVHLDPEAPVVAAHQAEAERLDPRSRLYLGFEHQVARTLDGRAVPVLARAQAPGDAARAVAAGADGIVILREPDEGALEAALREAGGKPVTVAVGSQERLRVLAARGEMAFTPALPAEADGAVFWQARRVLDDSGVRVPLAALVRLDAGPPPGEWELPAGRIFALCGRCLDAAVAPRLADLAAAGARAAASVAAVVERTPGEALLAVGLGASEVVVRPEEVAATKGAIREAVADEWRGQARLLLRSAQEDGS